MNINKIFKHIKMPPKKDDAKSSKERFAKWYEKNKEKLHVQKIRQRVIEGSVPNHASLEKYSITLEQVNCWREEGGHEQIHTREQLADERKLSPSQRGTKTYIRCVPVTEHVPAAIDGPQPVPKKKFSSAAPAEDVPLLKGITAEITPPEIMKTLEEAVGKTYMKAGKPAPVKKSTISGYKTNARLIFKIIGAKDSDNFVAKMRDGGLEKIKAWADAQTEIGADGKRINLAEKRKSVFGKGLLAMSKWVPVLREALGEKMMLDITSLDQKYHAERDKETKELQDLRVAKSWAEIIKRADCDGRPSDSIEQENMYLLCHLYTKLPPIRDNYTRVEFIKNDKEIKEGKNYYNLTTKTFTFQQFKSAEHHGKVTTMAYDPKAGGIKHKDLPRIIADSYKARPRKFLIEKPDGGTYSELKSKLKKIFGFAINPLRHSYITWFFQTVKYNEKLLKLEANRMHNTPDIFAMYRYFGGEDTSIKDFSYLYEQIDAKGEKAVLEEQEKIVKKLPKATQESLKKHVMKLRSSKK